MLRSDVRVPAMAARPRRVPMTLHGGAAMSGRTVGGVVLCGWMLTVGSLQAHHSLAGVYDMHKEAEVKGSVEKIQFVNPHGSLTLAVKNPDGTTTDWVFTLGSATSLAQ